MPPPETISWLNWLPTATWVIPTLTALASLPWKRDRHLAVKWVNLIGSALNLALAIGLLFAFMQSARLHGTGAGGRVTQLHLGLDFPWFSMLNIHYTTGVDALSALMILLTAIIVFCGVLASWGVREQAKEFFILINVLAAGVFGTFISFDLFTLFLFYEVAVLPMYLLIGVWGSGKKEYGAMKLTLMLVAGSALIFAGILALYFQSGLHTFNLNALSQVPFSLEFQRWAFPVIFIGFGVLSAFFPFHTWSPDGHAAAPTAVSMLHAGVLMKLGGYGCLRVAMYVLPEGCREWMPLFLALTTVNVACGAFIATRQDDLKYITAYSSVSHVGMVILGLCVMTFGGLKGSSMQMISHGLLTALFFCLIGMIYGRTHTRLIHEMGGLMKVMPFLSVAFVIAGFAGLGLPSLSGFVAEVTLFLGAFVNGTALGRTCAVIAILSITATAVYVLRAANRMLNGPMPHTLHDLTDATFVEKIPVLVLIVCLFGMGLFPGWMGDLLDGSLQPIFNNLMR